VPTPTSTTAAPSFVRFAGQAAVADVRTATYNGSEVVIVPVIAMVGDAVVTGMLSDGPEFVPADVLAQAPQSLSGRPVVTYHPVDHEKQVMANTPENWEQIVIGQVFNARFEKNRLMADVYIDKAKAAQVGDEAVSLVDKALAKEMFEVSLGAWVWQVPEDGVSPNGQKYSSRWIGTIWDHLACGLSRHGGRGACDIGMGCGGPRLMSAAQATAIKENSPMRLLDILAGKVGDLSTLADGMSDSDLRRKLNQALDSTIPAFQGVAEVFPESSTAIYMTSADGGLQWWECGFSVDGENVTIGRKKQVEPVTKWERVAAAGADETTTITTTATATEAAASQAPPANQPCQCQHAHNDKGANMSKITELAGKLIALAAIQAAKKGETAVAVYAEADRPKLEALSEAQLTATIAAFEKPEPAPAPEPKPETPAPTPEPAPTPKSPADAVVLTAAEHKRLVSMAAREETREKARRTQLITALTADERAKVVFTEAQLAAKPTDELEQLAVFAGLSDGIDAEPVSYAGRGALAVGALTTDTETHQAPPDPWKVPALAKALGYRTAQ